MLDWLRVVSSLLGCMLFVTCARAVDEPGPSGAGRPLGSASDCGACDRAGHSGDAAAIDAGAASAGGESPPTAAGAGADPAGGITLERANVDADTSTSLSDADFSTFVAQLNAFGLDLNQAQTKANGYAQKNLVFSPLSATMALAMVYAGTRGQTASEMKAVLGDSFTGDTFHVAVHRLMRELRARATSRTDDAGRMHKLELNLVDSIFVERTLLLEAPFLELLAREYDSGVRQVDFENASEPARLAINDWVAKETKHRISALIPPDAIDPLTRVVLVNALYFYGSWSVPFAHEGTTDAAFHTLSGDVQVSTMHAQRTLNYASHDPFVVAELPYEDDALRMTIVLPAQGMFESVRAQVSSAWLERAVTGMTPTQLQLALPKFKLTTDTFTLKGALQALGMKSAFDASAADLSGMATEPGLYISDVLQKAFIGVDEEGTEAAAATAAVVSATGVPIAPPTSFIVDRPCLFFIRDKSGAVLFAGQVVDPSK